MGHLSGVQAVQYRSRTGCTAVLVNEYLAFALPKISSLFFAVLPLLFALFRNELYSIPVAYSLKTVQQNTLFQTYLVKVET